MTSASLSATFPPAPPAPPHASHSSSTAASQVPIPSMRTAPRADPSTPARSVVSAVRHHPGRRARCAATRAAQSGSPVASGLDAVDPQVKSRPPAPPRPVRRHPRRPVRVARRVGPGPGGHVGHIRLPGQPQLCSFRFPRTCPAYHQHPPRCPPDACVPVFQPMGRTVRGDRVPVTRHAHPPEPAAPLEFPRGRHPVIGERHHRDRVRPDQPPCPQPPQLSRVAQHVEERDVIRSRPLRRIRHRPRGIKQPFPAGRRNVPSSPDGLPPIAAPKPLRPIAPQPQHLINDYARPLSYIPVSQATQARGAPAARLRPAGSPARTLDQDVHQPRKESRTWRSGLSTLRSTRAMDCHVPRARRPPITGMVAYGGTKAGMTWDRPCPRAPWGCRHRSSAGSSSARAARRSSSLRAPSSITAIPAVACGTKTCSSPSSPSAAVLTNSAQSRVISLIVSRFPVRTPMICVFMSRIIECTQVMRGPGDTAGGRGMAEAGGEIGRGVTDGAQANGAQANGAQANGAQLRLARQARGLSQQQLAGVAGVTRQAVSAVESGHSDPSLRVALAVARALGMTVEELFGPGDPADPVLARPGAPASGEGSRVVLATVGDTFVALPLHTDTAARVGFGAAGGLVVGAALDGKPTIEVRPIGPPRPTLVVAGCDPALPLLETPRAASGPAASETPAR